MSPRPDLTLPLTPLRSWRKSADGFPYAELARRVGCSRRTILRAAAGEAPRRMVAIAIARETSLSLELLLGAALPPRAWRAPEVPTIVRCRNIEPRSPR